MHSRDSLIIATFKYYCSLQETAKDPQYWSLQIVLLVQHWDRQGDGTTDLAKMAHLNTSGALLRDVNLPEAVIGTSVHIVYSIPCHMRLVTTTPWSNPSQISHQLMAPLKLQRIHPRTLSLPSPWTCHDSCFYTKTHFKDSYWETTHMRPLPVSHSWSLWPSDHDALCASTIYPESPANF